MTKLSKAQADALRTHRTGCLIGRRNTMSALVKFGYAKPEAYGAGRHTIYNITDAGRAAIAAHDAN